MYKNLAFFLCLAYVAVMPIGDMVSINISKGERKAICQSAITLCLYTNTDKSISDMSRPSSLAHMLLMPMLALQARTRLYSSDIIQHKKSYNLIST